ncbi:hypothetical protein [uncultured Nostoc sp.]|uniref:hypothetical protein n=1 Tax=uncultured Nostoc sp. TaxID=340711 RepID=UPI0035CC07F8
MSQTLGKLPVIAVNKHLREMLPKVCQDCDLYQSKLALHLTQYDLYAQFHRGDRRVLG